MKSLSLLILLLTALPTLARLGETRAECEKRYGTVHMTRSPDSDSFRVRKAKLQIEIRYLNGKASQISYTRLAVQPKRPDEKPEPLTEAEYTVLLEANKGNSEWEKIHADNEVIMWKLADDAATASLWVNTSTLSITTRESARERERKRAEKAAGEAKKLEGL